MTLLPPKFRYPLGMCALLGVVFLWVGSGFVLENVFHDYSRPFFVTYFNTSAFAINLIPLAIKLLYKRCRSKRPTSSSSASTSSSSSEHAKIVPATDTQTKNNATPPTPEPESNVQPLTVWQTARVATEFCLLWFVANYLNNSAYVHTTVASATIMSSLSGCFTLFVSVICGADSFPMTKILGVIITVGGAILVGVVDQSENSPGPGPKNALLGDMLALGGALFYAFYVTQLKLRVKHESAVDMSLFFAFLGCINAIGLAPIIGILHLTQLETFSLPSCDIFLQMAINALLGTVLSDYLWMFSALLVGPVVTTLGLSLTTPVSMMGEIILHNKSFAALYVLGASLIVIGFVFVNLDVPFLEKFVPERFQRYTSVQAQKPVHSEKVLNKPKLENVV